MKRLPALAVSAALSACASTQAPPATLVPEHIFGARVEVGQTTRAELLGAFGPTRKVVFDNGAEVWLYVANAGAQHYTELVLLIGPDGVVRQSRRRAP